MKNVAGSSGPVIRLTFLAVATAVAATPQQTVERVDPALREMAARGETLPVIITLSHQPHEQILERVRARSRHQIQNLEEDYRRLADTPLIAPERLRETRQRVEAAEAEAGQEAAGLIEAEIGPQQDWLEA